MPNRSRESQRVKMPGGAPTDRNSPSGQRQGDGLGSYPKPMGPPKAPSKGIMPGYTGGSHGGKHNPGY